jgi:hypothetical protein
MEEFLLDVLFAMGMKCDSLGGGGQEKAIAKTTTSSPGSHMRCGREREYI